MRSSRQGLSRRRVVGISLLTACVALTPLYAIAAGAAPTSEQGSVTETNNCNVTLSPQIQPPGIIPLTSQLSTTGSPQPHTVAPVTLSATTFKVTYPAAALGGIPDGTVFSATGSLVLAGSNTTEATHTYALNGSAIHHTNQPLTVAFNLQNTTWHPVQGNTALAFRKQSYVFALSFNFTGIGVITATSNCAQASTTAVVTLNGSPNTTTTVAPKPALAACSGSTGAINSVLTNNGVGGKGLLYAKKSPQQFKASASGQTCTGGLVSGARTKMTVTTQTPVNCQTLPATPTHAAVPLGGSGTFTWTAPPGMGTSNFNVQWSWTSNKTIHFSGSVSAAGSASNLFRGKHVSGNMTTLQSLAPVASGGSCNATQPLTHFDITKIAYRIT